eukprot:TRINITY_DN10887_c0_g1_i4.p1 TRINITY_DN10887_c0_g1~~TRINITY_DN10887_c0_g1_i4.p1  ORF type:complete len:227 (+),score=34.92 TRINITY_DN10887_c0_g1_i4:788-1468(+)
MIKSEEEVEVMKIAAEASAEGHIRMMRKCRAGLLELHLMGHFRDYGLFAYNSKIKPYPDIVASGPNAAFMHYDKNQREIQPKEMILCDCAYRIGNYCADITTTFPSDGKFTKKQGYYFAINIIREIYELVLGVNKAIQKEIKAGVSWMNLEVLSYKLLLSGLIKLGIVKGKVENLYMKLIHRLFMPHSLGHLLVMFLIRVGTGSTCRGNRVFAAGIFQQENRAQDN